MAAFYVRRAVIAFPRGRARGAVLEKIGKYEIRLQIGRGAMGVVYEGFDPSIGRRVAIKTLRTEMFEPRQLPDVLVRFKREAQSAGRLSHPHIVTIHEYGEEQGTPYIVMEYMSGNELGHRLERGSRFALDEVVRIMTQMLGALGHAHEHGVVHRDLKPANMFLLEDGSLKVVDFGIARVEASDLTDTGAMLGTPAYMSPEQCLGTQVDHRSDLFSAGVILYQLLTGDKPFTGSVTTIIQKVLRQEPLPPSELNPTLSPAWDKVIARAMAKKPEARFESARQFAEAVKTALTAERSHEDEVRRKAAEAEEHAQRAAEERSRAESLRRAEDERREAERRAKLEADARKEAEARARAEAARRKAQEEARRKADETVAQEAPPSRSRKLVLAALSIATVLGVVAAIFYQRDDAVKRAAEAEAARAGEERARQDAEKTRQEVAGKVADANRRAEEARREAERVAQAQAEERGRLEAERSKKEVDEKAKAEVLKKEEEAKRKSELAAKAAAELQAKKEAEAKAKAQSEEKARLEAEARTKREAEEKAKADAERKAEEARREARKPGTVFRDCDGCPEMVVVPAGSFLMGSSASEEGRDDDEGPQRRVTISRPFAPGRYEVTFEEWDACVRESGCSHNPGDFGWGRGRRPVINVSWQDARQFTDWLSRKTGRRYRLLTEAEWEYVARAGTTSAFSTGATIGLSRANYAGSRKQTVPVGSFGPNTFGLYDVHGNVWEWTEDCWNASYAGAPSNGSAWLTGNCSLQVNRGGSWGFSTRSVRSALRGTDSTDYRGHLTGFRLARTLE